MTRIAQEFEEWVKTFEVPTSKPLVLMLSGAQGSGKSTLMEGFADRNPGVCAVSLDDFYFSKKERRALSRKIHPLFETRGPPGTHDIAALCDVLERLIEGSDLQEISWPAFSKTADDRLPECVWPRFKGRPEIILLEGWVLGALPDPTSKLSSPINAIEHGDEDGKWREYQEQQLSTEYARLWDFADGFFHLKAPSFEVVRTWRLQQEASNQGIALSALEQKHIDWVDRFVLHYERITRRMLNGGHKPGHVVQLDMNRKLMN